MPNERHLDHRYLVYMYRIQTINISVNPGHCNRFTQ